MTNLIREIWNDVRKDFSHLQDTELEHVFNLQFIALPHFRYARSVFEAEVKKLKKRFTDKDAEDYIFKDTTHMEIPMDGVPALMD